MGRVDAVLRQEPVEPPLGVGKRRRNVEAEQAQARGANRDEKRGDGLLPPGQVRHPLLDEQRAREAFDLHARMLSKVARLGGFRGREGFRHNGCEVRRVENQDLTPSLLRSADGWVQESTELVKGRLEVLRQHASGSSRL